MTPDEYMKETAVLVTSHPKQHIFMRTAFESWIGYAGTMLLGYDNDSLSDLPIEQWSPPVTHTFVTGKPAGYYGHHRGELWQLKIGSKRLLDMGFKYFYKTAADNCCYRWRNLARMFKVLFGRGRPQLIICGTTQIFGELETFVELMDDWGDHITHCGGAECFLYHMLADHKVRDVRNKVTWWNEILGLIHLQGEYALNTGISVVDTWAIGQQWGEPYSHRDLDPRVKFLKPHIRKDYEHFVSQGQAVRR